MKLASMRARLTLILALSIACFLVVLSVGYLVYARRTLEAGFAASLDQMALTSENLAESGADLTTLRQQLDRHNAQVVCGGVIGENVEAWLVDSRGNLRQHFGFDVRAPQLPSLQPPPPGGLRPALPPRGSGTTPAPPQPPIPPLDRPQDWRMRTLNWSGGTLILALPWHRARHELTTQAIALVIFCALTTGVAALGAYVLVGRTLSPIKALARQAETSMQSPSHLLQESSQGNFAVLQPTSSDHEIRHLVATLNGMLERVHEAALSKERFHTSASHELRTPLQALAGHLSVALSRDRDVEEYKQVLEEAAQQTARLSKLTNELLLLNRLQTATRLPHQEKVDVAEVCDIALQRAAKTLEARGLRLHTQWEPLDVWATPSHVEILLGNLLENAAKYARSGGEIGIELSAAQRSVCVWNDCDEADYQNLQNDLTKLTEPFYRRDEARTSDGGGNGLGLAICQAIAMACNWNLTILAEEQQVRVQVIFPPATPSPE